MTAKKEPEKHDLEDLVLDPPILSLVAIEVSVLRIRRPSKHRFRWVVAISADKWWNGVRGFRSKRKAEVFAYELREIIIRRPSDDTGLCNGAGLSSLVNLFAGWDIIKTCDDDAQCDWRNFRCSQAQLDAIVKKSAQKEARNARRRKAKK